MIDLERHTDEQVLDPAGVTASQPFREGVPRWPFLTAIVYAVALFFAARATAAWILHLNAMRAVAEAMTASMARNDAAARMGHARKPLVDPLNPYTWTPDVPQADWIDPAERERTEKAARQIAFVEIGVLIWKWAVWATAFVVAVLGFVGLLRANRRRRLAAGAIGLTFVPAVLSVVGMWLLVAKGGFDPRPAREYQWVAMASSAYGWLLLLWLGLRWGALSRPAGTGPCGISRQLPIIRR